MLQRLRGVRKSHFRERSRRSLLLCLCRRCREKQHYPNRSCTKPDYFVGLDDVAIAVDHMMSEGKIA